MDRPLAVIFDRDGTLAAVHNGPSTGGKTDTGDYRYTTKDQWSQFNAALVFDAVVPETAALLRAIRPGVVRIMVSGRAQGDKPGETFRYWQMVQWIEKNNLPIDYLYMRKAADTRLDSIVKEEILENLILPRFNPIVAVDDRPAICEVWRKHGIHTICVTNPATLPPIAFQTLEA